jgi:hypothetical protein
MPASLQNQFISDLYTSLLHLSGLNLTNNPDVVNDGLGNATSLQLSLTGAGFNNIVFPDSQSPLTPVNFIDYIYPVNSILMSFDNNNPGTRFIGTAWIQVSQGEFLAGQGTGTDTNGATKTFNAGDLPGEYTHKLTIPEMPSHNHNFSMINLIDNGERDNNRQAGENYITTGTSFTGGDQPHNNLPPGYVVYVWKRTA